MAVAVVDCGDGPIALPIVEIRPDSGCTTTPPATRREPLGSCARPSSTTIAQRCSALALRVHDVLGLRDLSRTDMIVTDAVSRSTWRSTCLPGMTETSSVPLAIEAAGWSLGKMCADLVRVAAGRTETASVP